MQINGFINKLDDYDKRYCNYLIGEKGYTGSLDYLLHDLDCSRTFKDGSRRLNTKHTAYITGLGKYEFILNEAKVNEALPFNLILDYEKAIDDLVIANNEFEVDNPPIIYNTKVDKSNKRIRKAKTKDMFTGKETIEDITEDGGIIKKPKNATERRKEMLSKIPVTFTFKKS